MEEELELAQQKLHERELRIAELEADVGELTEARDAAQQQLSAVLIERDALRQAQDAALKRKRADEGASPVWRRNSQLGQNLADRDAKIRQLERLLKKCEKNLAKARQDAGKRLSGDGSHAPPAAHMQLQQQQQQEHPQPQADTLPAGAAAGSGGSGGATAAAVAAQPAAGVLAPGEPAPAAAGGASASGPIDTDAAADLLVEMPHGGVPAPPPGQHGARPSPKPSSG